jgi:regulator of protease activity HflC (stomatin/prohibitin superfamily)
MSFEDIDYSTEVTAQLSARQNAIQQVRLAQENARKAQQDAITAEELGKANAAKAKWEQETIKAKLVTEAQQKLEVATLAAKEAEQYKREQILRGEGDGERRRLVLAADGALDAKLEAYKAVMAGWSTAFGQFKGQLVPQVTMGAGSAGANGMTGAQGLVEMLSAKTARDLALDLSNAGAAATAKK